MRPADARGFTEMLGDWMVGRGVLHRHLSSAIARVIHSGQLPVGQRLPSERALATAASVSRATVVAAYDGLRDQGLVESRQGSGTTVAARVGRRREQDPGPTGGAAHSVFARLARGPGEVISMTQAFDVGEPALREALLGVVEDDLPHLLHDVGYRPRGLPALRSAIADHHSQRGLPTDPDQLVVTTGAHQAVVLAAQGLIRPGATVLVESPGWPGSHDLFEASGAHVVGVGMDEEGIRPDLLQQAMAGHAPALLFLMPTFHNPTGRLMSASRRRQVAVLAGRYDVAVVEDLANDVASGSAGRDVPPPVAAFAPPSVEVVTIRSLSKLAWGGLRVGWLRASAPVAQRLAHYKTLADLGTPVIDQAVAARLLGRFDDLAARRGRDASTRLRHLERELGSRLPAWTWQRPAGGSALWVRLPDTDTSAYAQVALRHGVEVVPGRTMDLTGHHDDHLRLPATYSADVLSEVVARLGSAWTEFQRLGPAPRTGALRIT